MYRPVQHCGYLALLLAAGALLLGAVRAPVTASFGSTGALVGVASTVAVAGAAEHRRELAALEPTAFDRSDAVDATAVAVGALVTYVLSVDAGLGPIVASAAVGLGAGLAVPRVGPQVYCGSFVGMASPAVFGSLEAVALAGAIAGVGFVVTTASFGGVGGKLGTIAMVGCLATAGLLGLEFADPSAPQWDHSGLVVPVAAVSAVGTVVASRRLEWGPVVGSGAVGLVAGVALPVASPSLGSTLAAVAFCASFVGMSGSERLPGLPLVAVAGALSGFVFLAVTPAFDGAGGKLGTIAFVSCIACLGAVELRDAVAGL